MRNQSNHLIALADDDADDREIFAEACAEIDADTKVLYFENAIELLDYMEVSTNRLPSILFLDINMPVKDGFETLHEIRNDLELNELCIIMYSTSITNFEISRARNLGADGFMQKPTDFEKMKSSLKKIFDTNWDDPCEQLDDTNFLINA